MTALTIVPLALLLVLALILLVGAGYHAVASRRDLRRHPPTGELVTVGARRFHLVRAGEGQPTVVLDSALAGTSLSWAEIQPKLGELARVVSYDRAGFGWSDPSPEPRTVDNMVEELDRLLDAAGIAPPYVLVGHSYGGWIALLYASLHRDKVAGLVLVDSPHPSEWMSPDPKQRSRVERGARLARRAAWAARFGAMRMMFLLSRVRVFSEHERVADLLKKTPASIRDTLKTFWVRPATLEALASQIENAPESAERVFNEMSDLGELPLVTITAANPDARRLEHQLQTTALSRDGRHVIATTSGHWIPLEEPGLVIDAVRSVVASLR